MEKLIIASNNAGKVKEFREILGDKYNVLSLKDENINIEIEETGKTFRENALLKAQAIYKISGENVLADDSGLRVYSLGGEPGVYSARYAGEDGNSEKNIDKLLKELTGKKDRKAEFVCSIAFIKKSDEVIYADGATQGEITFERKGKGGFGYDAVFYSYEIKKTFGEGEEKEKNAVSHRAKAIKELMEAIK